MTAELRRRLKKADPDLTIVPGGIRHSKKKIDPEEEWVAATGVICAECGKESHRSREGLCMACWEKKMEDQVEVRDQVGFLNIFPRSILEQITHPARKPKP